MYLEKQVTPNTKNVNKTEVNVKRYIFNLSIAWTDIEISISEQKMRSRNPELYKRKNRRDDILIFLHWEG